MTEKPIVIDVVLSPQNLAGIEARVTEVLDENDRLRAELDAANAELHKWSMSKINQILDDNKALLDAAEAVIVQHIGSGGGSESLARLCEVVIGIQEATA